MLDRFQPIASSIGLMKTPRANSIPIESAMMTKAAASTIHP